METHRAIKLFMKSPFSFGKRATKTSELLLTAEDVWRFLKKVGGLAVDSYDKDISDELFASLVKLFPSSDVQDIDALLRRESISVEDFLSAFFKIAQPFVEMMVDLLHLFEEANANQ